MLYFLLSLIPLIYLTIIKSKKSIHMLQQNYYDESNRYLLWIKNNLKKVFFTPDLGLFIIVIGFVLNNYITMILFSLLTILSIIEFKSIKEQVKKPLVITARVKRMFITEFILYSIMLLVMVLLFKDNNITIYYLILSAITYLNHFMLWLVNKINIPVEKCVYLHFKHMAQNKLFSMNLPVIGITGSYGKTSSKNILNDILNVKFNAFATPKNFNTPYGLIRSINQYLDKFNDLFIAEMGAFKVGEIATTCKLVKPKYGILTTIGEAHLESFGSRENIQKGKFELIESLPHDGIGILNGDDPYQRNYKLKNDCKVLWIGIDSDDVDLKATNIKLSGEGTTFDCIFKGDKKKYTFQTKLLGRHNVYNILAAILLGHELGMSIDELKRGVAIVKTIEHRLELKPYGTNYIIDDAYNSNPVGSKMALDVLGLMDGIKIVVTPGMIELGDKQYEANYNFGTYISEVADYVILVGKNQTKPIYDGLIKSKYKKEKIYVINDVKEAFPIMNKLATKKTYILLENDLPDLFNE